MSRSDWLKINNLSRLNPTIHRFDSVDSTNETVKELLLQTSEQHPVVLATQQTQGKGRMVRKWISPEGGLYLSLGIDLRIPIEKSPLLVMLVGCACVDAIRELTATKVGLKWPNDIIIDERKVGGILCELVYNFQGIHYVIAGIGINVNLDVNALPIEIQKKSTSLVTAFGEAESIEKLAATILTKIDSRLIIIEGESGIESILKEWEEFSFTIGRKISVNLGKTTIYGTAIGISTNGSLIVRETSGKQITVDVGDVVHLYPDDT